MPSPKSLVENEHLLELKKRVSKAPTDPGIYRWIDKNGHTLYIGKAKNLKNRLKSYVSPSKDAALGPWKLSMLKQITDFSVTVTNTELEALILETNLIKEEKPKYNVMMKDDKNYVYVQITMDDTCPTIEVVRRMIDPNAKYFGPFTAKQHIDRTLDMLDVVLHFRSCKKSIEQLNKGMENGELEKECLEYQIGKCNGLCVGSISKEEYQERIDKVIRFLKGDHQEVSQVITNEMQEAATNKNFEKAAKLRDALQAIEAVQEQQLVSDTTGEDTDYIGVALLKNRAQVMVLREREGKLIGEQSIPLKGEAESIAEVLEQFLPQFYTENLDIPDVVVIGEDTAEKPVIEEWLSEKRGKKIEVRIPERGKKSKLLDLAEKNALEKIKQQEAQWESAARNIDEALEGLKNTLDLSDPPKRIEGFDISHLGGTETVGSMVVFIKGKATNDQYRSFTIRSMKEGDIDDYKAMKEVLKRRLLYLTRNLKEEEKKWNEKGITFGKARKGEKKAIEEIIKQQPNLSEEDLDYKNFTIARKDKDIVSLVRFFVNKDKTQELKSLWVHDEYRGDKLGQFLSRLMLSKVKKGKVYITIDPGLNLEEYYNEMGFRYIHDAPKVLKEKTKRFCEQNPHAQLGIFMMYDTLQNKPDSSLNTIPDLIVIDGGKGQLSTVMEVMKELEIEISVIGLAKREEEVFVPNESDPVHFQKDSQALFLLQRIRNEAHRSANNHREKRIAKHATQSVLDDVPGIGEKTKEELLRKFGSVSGIKEASDEELQLILNESQLSSLRSVL